jgi:sulfur relay (sulfurtransferase) complex TusBCD TusD component (DsrE family)
MTLSELATQYQEDRAALDATHPPHANVRVCRYCGRARGVWKAARFEGHVGCVVTPAFMQRVVEFYEAAPAFGHADVALALGVTPPIVRAWWNIAKGNPRP